MAFITIDKEKCTQCGACAAVCPAGLILKKVGRTPRDVPWAEKACIDCGHCVAVCPEAALSTARTSVDACRPVEEELELTGEQVRQFLSTRRSIRAFLDRAVPRDVLASVLETVRYAPSGHNRQTLQWLVILEKSEVERLCALVREWMAGEVEKQTRIAEALRFGDILKRAEAGDDVVLRHAPHLVVAHAPKDDRFAPRDAVIALTTLELAVRGHGLGACWAGYLDLVLSHSAALREALALPDGNVPLGSMMVGFPKYRYARIPPRREAPVIWR